MDVLLRECIWLAIQLLMEMAAALAIDCAGGLVYTCVASAFFFTSRRRHTSFDCDWISDVCSSDLRGALRLPLPTGDVRPAGEARVRLLRPAAPGRRPARRSRRAALRSQDGKARTARRLGRHLPARRGACGARTFPRGSAGRACRTRCQAAARPVKERFDRSDGQPELVRDLGVRESLPFAKQDGPALALRQGRECLSKGVELLGPFVAVGRGCRQLVHVFDLPCGRVDTADGPLCLATDVECDLEQPSELELGLDAALK